VSRAYSAEAAASAAKAGRPRGDGVEPRPPWIFPSLSFKPCGAAAWCRGWSAPRRMAGGAQPVGEVRKRRTRPARGGGTSFAPPGREQEDRQEEEDSAPASPHGFRVGPLRGRAAPPAATIRGPVGAEDSPANPQSAIAVSIMDVSLAIGGKNPVKSAGKPTKSVRVRAQTVRKRSKNDTVCLAHLNIRDVRHPWR